MKKRPKHFCLRKKRNNHNTHNNNKKSSHSLFFKRKRLKKIKDGRSEQLKSKKKSRRRGGLWDKTPEKAEDLTADQDHQRREIDFDFAFLDELENPEPIFQRPVSLTLDELRAFNQLTFETHLQSPFDFNDILFPSLGGRPEEPKTSSSSRKGTKREVKSNPAGGSLLGIEFPSFPSGSLTFREKKKEKEKEAKDFKDPPLSPKPGGLFSSFMKKETPRPVEQTSPYGEFIESEKAYFRDLSEIVNTYVRPLQKQGILSEVELRSIFGNIEAIFEFYSMYIEDLDKKPFVDTLSYLSKSVEGLYTIYFRSYSMGIDKRLLNAKRGNPRLETFLRKLIPQPKNKERSATIASPTDSPDNNAQNNNSNNNQQNNGTLSPRQQHQQTQSQQQSQQNQVDSQLLKKLKTPVRHLRNYPIQIQILLSKIANAPEFETLFEISSNMKQATTTVSKILVNTSLRKEEHAEIVTELDKFYANYHSCYDTSYLTTCIIIDTRTKGLSTS